MGHNDLARSLEQLGRNRQSWSLCEELPFPTACPDHPPAWRFFTRAMGAERCLRHHASGSRAVAKQFVSSYGIASYYAVIGTMTAHSTGWRRLTPSAMERWCGSRCTRISMDCLKNPGFAVSRHARNLIREFHRATGPSKLRIMRLQFLSPLVVPK